MNGRHEAPGSQAPAGEAGRGRRAPPTAPTVRLRPGTAHRAEFDAGPFDRGAAEGVGVLLRHALAAPGVPLHPGELADGRPQVRRVDLRVESQWAGSRGDLDHLVLSVETDGRHTPAVALGSAATRLLAVLEDLVPAPTPLPGPPVPIDDGPGTPLTRASRVERLGLPLRCGLALQAAGVSTVGALVDLSEADLLRLPHLGRRAVAELQDLLLAAGLMLRRVAPGRPGA